MPEPLDLGSLIEEFRDEARDQVDHLDAALIRIERDGRLEDETRSDLLRTLHTLKGNAGMLGLAAIRDYVHALENTLKAEVGTWPEHTLERLFDGAAVLRRAVDEAGGDSEAAHRDLTAARHRLETLGAGPSPGAVDPGPETTGGERPAGTDRLRVPFAKLDALLNQVGELIGEADALRVALAAVGGGVRERAETIRRRGDALRETVMDLRLVPLGRVLGRFRGLVRRLAREQEKEARLVVHGEETEVDKSTADALAEPLLHLLRNAIDHGIERPEAREAAGRPRHGTIRIAASQEGDGVRIVVEDDGAGLDLERIRERAREVGLVPAGTRLSRAELVDLIFRPGFSTRADVSTVSGQGVGLDVVRRSIRDLRGDLRVEGVEEGGTRFVLRLPLTVAIVPSVVFEAAGETLAVPATHVGRTLRIDAVERVGPTEVVRSGDHLVPLADPDRLFGWDPSPRGGLGVELRHDRGMAVLTAGRVIEQRDLVVKALPAYGPRPRGVSGASVLPGGRVVLLLDPVEVIELTEERRGGGEA